MCTFANGSVWCYKHLIATLALAQCALAQCAFAHSLRRQTAVSFADVWPHQSPVSFKSTLQHNICFLYLQPVAWGLYEANNSSLVVVGQDASIYIAPLGDRLAHLMCGVSGTWGCLNCTGMMVYL